MKSKNGKIKNILKRVYIGYTAFLIAFFSMCLVTYAQSDVIVKYFNDKCSKGEQISNSVSNYFTDSQTEYNTSALVITKYNDANGNTENKVLYYNPLDEDKIINEINKQNDNENALDIIEQSTDDFNIKANVKEGYSLFKGVVPYIEVFLGVVYVILTFGMAFFSGMDLVYLSFGTAREKMQNNMNSNGIMAQKRDDGSCKLRFVSDEAIHALETATIESGKNKYIEYFKHRVISYIILSVLMFILLTGNIVIFTKLGAKLAQGVLELFANMA